MSESDSMIERVARAIYSANPAEEAWQGAGHEPRKLTWEEAPDDHEWCLWGARAAIEAMREPTEAMKQAMFWQGGIALEGYRKAIDGALVDATEARSP